MTIHPEGKLCRHVRSRFECLFSMTLMPGERVRVGEEDVCARRCGRASGRIFAKQERILGSVAKQERIHKSHEKSSP